MTDIELLQRTRALLSQPFKWTKKSYARDGLGNDCLPNEGRAFKFCIAGAALKVSQDDTADYRISQLLGPYLPSHCFVQALDGPKQPCVARFNDDPDTTHEDILALLDAAITGGPTLEHVRELLDTVKSL